ncbi:hypothetical protein P3L10_029720 [Capsicum annuum]
MNFQCHSNSCTLEVSLSKEEVFWGKYPFSVDKGVAQSVCGIIWKGMNSRKKLTLRITFSS